MQKLQAAKKNKKGNIQEFKGGQNGPKWLEEAKTAQTHRGPSTNVS